jgi:hypothetical protein
MISTHYKIYKIPIFEHVFDEDGWAKNATDYINKVQIHATFNFHLQNFGYFISSCFSIE